MGDVNLFSASFELVVVIALEVFHETLEVLFQILVGLLAETRELHLLFLGLGQCHRVRMSHQELMSVLRPSLKSRSTCECVLEGWGARYWLRALGRCRLRALV
jgi:hypothetical protein